MEVRSFMFHNMQGEYRTVFFCNWILHSIDDKNRIVCHAKNVENPGLFVMGKMAKIMLLLWKDFGQNFTLAESLWSIPCLQKSWKYHRWWCSTIIKHAVCLNINPNLVSLWIGLISMASTLCCSPCVIWKRKKNWIFCSSMREALVWLMQYLPYFTIISVWLSRNRDLQSQIQWCWTCTKG